MTFRVSLAVVALVATMASAHGQDQAANLDSTTPWWLEDSNVFVFGGLFSSESVGETFNVIGTDYQDAYILGGGVQKFVYGQDNGLKLGIEAGASLRKGPDVSGEVWAGAVIRADGFVHNDTVKVSASVTGGFSATSSPLDVEIDREISRGGGDSSFLFYMAPELSLSFNSNPNVEIFYRLQHRSGGWETLGGMGEGSNANTVGLRYHF